MEGYASRDEHLKTLGIVVVVLSAPLAVSACGGHDKASERRAALPQGNERVHLDPADFTTRIDNPPLEPKVRECKFFARRVGLVRAFEVAGGSGHEELLSFKKTR